MYNTTSIIANLNDITACTGSTGNDWWSVLQITPNVDVDATRAADPTTARTVVATESGQWFRWDQSRHTWYESDAPTEPVEARIVPSPADLAATLIAAINAGRHDDQAEHAANGPGEMFTSEPWTDERADEYACDIATHLAVMESGEGYGTDFIDVGWHATEHQQAVADALRARGAALPAE